MSDYKYTFEVTMTCGGCSNAVRKALEKNSEVITRFDIDQEKDTVRVDSELSREDVKAILVKTGKAVDPVHA
ncbi:Cytosolic copper metallochaperone [Mortierella sp. GBA43]|nr:Cytosolic copper metallochaperone [Mortierella sp. GBA43]